MEKMSGDDGGSVHPTEEKKTYKIKQVCMYCHKEYGEIEGGQTEGMVSHGVCPEPGCQQRFKKDMAIEKIQ